MFNLEEGLEKVQEKRNFNDDGEKGDGRGREIDEEGIEKEN